MARRQYCHRCGTEHDPKGPCPMDTGSTRVPPRSRRHGAAARAHKKGGKEVAGHPARWQRQTPAATHGRKVNVDFTCIWTDCEKTAQLYTSNLTELPPPEWHPAIYPEDE